MPTLDVCGLREFTAPSHRSKVKLRVKKQPILQKKIALMEALSVLNSQLAGKEVHLSLQMLLIKWRINHQLDHHLLPLGIVSMLNKLEVQGNQVPMTVLLA